MEKNVVLAIVLGALIIIAGLQAFQLFSLKNKVGSGNVQSVQTVSGANAPAAGQGSGASLPSNLQNLPAMVGGC